MREPEARDVRDWHRAFNGGDLDGLVALSHPEVEVGGPRGTGLLREWAQRSGIGLEPGRVVGEGDTVVVEQEAEWRSAGSGEVSGGQSVASVFLVRGGRIAGVDEPQEIEAG